MLFKSLSQNNPVWRNRPPARFSGTTIGSHGCLLTCITIVGNGISGLDLYPNELDAIMSHIGGYVKGNLLVWEKPCEIYNMRLEVLSECLWVPAPLDEIHAILGRGLPVIARVDQFTGVPVGGAEEHWIVILDNSLNFINPRTGFYDQLKNPTRDILAWAAYAPLGG